MLWLEYLIKINIANHNTKIIWRNLKTNKDEDQVINIRVSKMIHCLRYDVYNNNIDMDILNKVEVFKQYRQPVMNRENFDYFKSVIQKLLELDVRAMAMLFEKI